MKPKENIVIQDEDKEIRRFLARLLAARSLCVELDGEKFVIDVRREHVSEAGRLFLTRGGPSDE